MSSELSTIGFNRDRLDLILDRLRSISKNHYGDLNLEASTPDGQIVAILSEVLSRLHEQSQALVDMFDPNASSGDSLSELVKLNGLLRFPRTPTNTILTISVDDGGSPQVLSAPIFINSTGGGDQYIIPFDIYSIPGIDIQVYAEAVEFDTDVLPANELTVVETSVPYTITIISHPVTTLGKEEEPDSRLRARRESFSSSGGSSSNDKLYLAIKSLPDTLDVSIDSREGYSDPTFVDPDRTLVIVANIRGISAEVEAAWKVEVGKLMLQHLTLGVETESTTLAFYNEELKPISKQGFQHSMHIHNAEDRTVFIVVNVTELDGFPSTGAEDIKQAIVDFANEQGTVKYGLASVVYENELIPSAYRVPGHRVDDFWIGFTVPTFSNPTMTMIFTDIPNFDISNITVNVT